MKALKGTRTEKNLEAAFAGESQGVAEGYANFNHVHLAVLQCFERVGSTAKCGVPCTKVYGENAFAFMFKQIFNSIHCRCV